MKLKKIPKMTPIRVPARTWLKTADTVQNPCLHDDERQGRDELLVFDAISARAFVYRDLLNPTALVARHVTRIRMSGVSTLPSLTVDGGYILFSFYFR